MICNKCGKENSEGSKFCIGCGNELNLNNELSVVENTIQTEMEQPIVEEVVEQPQTTVTQPVVTETINANQLLVTNNLENKVDNSTNNNKPKKPLNKKMLFMIGGALLLVAAILVLVLFVFSGGKKEDKKTLESIFDINQPIPVKKDNGYVYINQEGKLIKNIKYNEASDFYNGVAYVELEDGTAALVDKNLEVKIKATSVYAIEYIEEYDMWIIDNVLYDKSLKPITDKTMEVAHLKYGFLEYENAELSEYGILNSIGKTVYTTKCQIDNVSISSDDAVNEKYYAVVDAKCYSENKEVEKEYLVSLQTGEVLYENRYKTTSSYVYSLRSSSDNIYYILDDDYEKIKYLYIKDDKIAYETSENLYDLELYSDKYLVLDYGYDYDELEKEQRYYYYNLETKKIEKEEPDVEKEEMSSELKIDEKQKIIVSCDTGYGIIDAKKVYLPCSFDNIEFLETNVYEYMKQVKSKELVLVEKDKNLSLYDINAKEDFYAFGNEENQEIESYNDSLFITQEIYKKSGWSSELEKTVVYNLVTEKNITFNSKSDIKLNMNYITESKNGKKIYYNMNLEKIYTEN